MRRATALVALTAALGVAAPAWADDPVRPGEESGPMGLVGKDVPDVLKEAKAQPYAPPQGDDCKAIQREIAELDKVLGPDADKPAGKDSTGEKASKLVTGVVKSMIPYRAVARMVTGANQKDQARTEAAMAGWARRGYLKGMEAQLGCPGATAAPPPPAAVADAQTKKVEELAASAPTQASASAPAAAVAIDPVAPAAPQPAPAPLTPPVEVAAPEAALVETPPAQAAPAESSSTVRTYTVTTTIPIDPRLSR